MKFICNFIVLFVFVAGTLLIPKSATSGTIDELVFLTENYPPFNYEKDGEIRGTSVNLLLKMFKQINSSKTVNDIEVVPWARGYRLAQKRKNTVLFSTTRTKSRENLFKWVGPIAPTKISVIAKKANKIKISKFDDLNNFQIGVVREDIGELLLKNNGINPSNIYSEVSSEFFPRMLNADHIDMWAYEESVAMWILKKDGYNPDDYETVYVLEESQLYFAIQKDTDDALVAKLQASLDAVRVDN